MLLRRCSIFLWALTILGFMPLRAAPPSPDVDQTPLSHKGPVSALIRFPTLHGNAIVFEAAGDLWKVGLGGGVAQRLTADSGFDSHPEFSPNGQQIAFTGWYQGNTDVYVMPSAGGPVRRLTYRSINRKQGSKLVPVDDNQVLGWTPNSKNVVFLSRRTSFNPQIFQAWEVPAGGGLPRRLPMPWSGPLSFNAAGTQVVYNKLYRNYSFHRKHYYGGKAQDLYTYDLRSGSSRRLTRWKGVDTFPMRIADKVYFASDRGPKRVLNLWVLDLTADTYRQLTHFKTYDIDWPSLSNTGIAFSDGGRLYVYALPSGRLRRVRVRLPLDGLRTQPYYASVGHMITGATLAPNGKLAGFSARGALFTVPAKYGRTTILTPATAADDRDPAWSPDGKWIAYIDDSGRRSVVSLRSASGGGHVRILSGGLITHNGPLTWSPDCNWLTYSDADQRLWVVNLKTGKSELIAQDRQSVIGAFQDVAWSPDSRWLAFSNDMPNHLRGLYIYDMRHHRLHKISHGNFSDFDPAFSENGKYLAFASSRLVNPALSGFGFVAASLVPDGLYITTLHASTTSPLAPRNVTPVSTSDKCPDVSPLKDRHRRAAHDKSCRKHGKPHVTINFHHLMDRSVRIDVPPANIVQIAVHGGNIDYLATPPQMIGGSLPGQTPQLRSFSLSKRKSLTLASDVGTSGFVLSADGSTLLFQKGNGWVIRPNKFKSGVDVKPKPLKLDNMRLHVDPRAEWQQIFNESWRDVRDYFVNPQLIRHRWEALGRTYGTLVPLAASRRDLNWIIGQMIGSLGESHMYVYGGAHPRRSAFTPTAGLGVRFALDRKSQRYYLARIYHGDNSIPGYTAPLAQPGMKVRQGDYVLAIDGQNLIAPTNPYSLLQGTLGQTVTLSVAMRPHATPHTVYVRPTANAEKLHLLAWIRRNRAEVSRLSNGKVGYIYLNDMEATGLHEFVRGYYSQLDKPGLIIDDRWNLGGFVDTLLFNRLNQRIVAAWVNRHGAYQQSPQDAYVGRMAALINHGSASDGDIFAFRFKKYHLGPTIGTRTWGGVRGYAAPFTLLDGGHLVVSEIAMYGIDSSWVVENVGVSPSTYQPLDPGALVRGHDTQIARAVQILMKEIHNHPGGVPAPPPWLPAFPPQITHVPTDPRSSMVSTR